MPKPKADAQLDPSLPRRVRDSIIRGPLPPTTDRAPITVSPPKIVAPE